MLDFISGLGMRVLLISFLVAVVLIVALQNLEPTSIDFLLWEIALVPKLYLLLFAFALGFISAVILLKWPTKAK